MNEHKRVCIINADTLQSHTYHIQLPVMHSVDMINVLPFVRHALYKKNFVVWYWYNPYVHITLHYM